MAEDLAAPRAEEVAYRFDIPAQPLGDALQAFARASRQQVSFDGAALAGKTSSGLSGDYLPEEALRRLLEGSGAVFTRGVRGVWMVGPAQPPPAASGRVAQWETIVVTGTNIHDVAPAGAPVLILDAEDIRASGYSSTEQLMQSLPQNFRGGEAGASADVNMSVGSQRGFNATAGSGVNLRGLGSRATLLLINGRRVAASSAGTFTDISMIPIDAIERIEVLTDGASAIYGADAVAGVVNVILKSDYDGAETRASYGFTTEGGRDEYRLSHNHGWQWSGGSMMLGAEYLHQGHLLASERGFTANVPPPTSIFPSNRLTSLVFSGRQRIGEALSLQADIQYSEAERYSVSTGVARSESFIRPTRRNAALGLEYRAFGDWTFSVDAFASDEDARNRLFAYTPDGAPNFDYAQLRTQDQWGAELRATGSVFDLPAGPAKLALGVSYKEEKYSRRIDFYDLYQALGRDSVAGFAELHLPLVGSDNAIPGIRRLDLSIAGRYDDYSDFGSTRNPRIGLSWSPISGLTLRSSYSTSFRAPSIGEEARFGEQGLFGIEILPFYAADGTDLVPVVMWLGSEDLRPEESDNWTFGLDWKPPSAPGLAVALTYYDIAYSDRIILPPFDRGALSNPELQSFVRFYDSPAELRALVEERVARGVFLVDATSGLFGPDPLSQATAAYSYLWTNADRVDVSGFDLGIDYPFRRGDNRFEVGLNANYIRRMLNRVSPSALPYDLAGTFANPPKLRARGLLSWSRDGLSSDVHVNYTHSYTDTSGLVDRPVDAYVTVDLVARYTFDADARGLTDGLSLSFTATNLLDEQPPYVEFGGGGSNYDAANASPLGRMVSLQVAKRW
ncbi:TonB-dependent receptor [Luteimonas sp. SJ-92]|uniref:TonB-dependent receptor n=1 Tax=Luteimonas salinisoli TaxID=2752307 RepID=A0A853JEY6_9GAMM|nr:TonB-dependent receptor [Luteimonas salinisoli]